MSHGNKEKFSCLGIKICVQWFQARGHKVRLRRPSFFLEMVTEPCERSILLVDCRKINFTYDQFVDEYNEYCIPSTLITKKWTFVIMVKGKA
jgi:hypothetical protein